jgi:hypothetical protein
LWRKNKYKNKAVSEIIGNTAKYRHNAPFLYPFPLGREILLEGLRPSNSGLAKTRSGYLSRMLVKSK